MESSLRKDILDMLQQLPVGQDVSINEIATRLNRDRSAIYQHLISMENVGLVISRKQGNERRVCLSCLLRKEGNGNPKTEELLSFLKTCQEFGLSGIDVKILKSGAEEPVEIARKTGLLPSVVQQHVDYIKKTRAKTRTLKEAKKKIFGRRKIPA